MLATARARGEIGYSLRVDGQLGPVVLWTNFQRMYLAVLLMSIPPVYSGKYFVNGTCARGAESVQTNSTIGLGTHLGQLRLEHVDLVILFFDPSSSRT